MIFVLDVSFLQLQTDGKRKPRSKISCLVSALVVNLRSLKWTLLHSHTKHHFLVTLPKINMVCCGSSHVSLVPLLSNVGPNLIHTIHMMLVQDGTQCWIYSPGPLKAGILPANVRKAPFHRAKATAVKPCRNDGWVNFNGKYRPWHQKHDVRIQRCVL